MDAVNRRDFLTQLGALAGLATMPGALLLSGDPERLVALVSNLGPVDEVVIDDLGSIAAEYARRSHREAPGPLLVAVHSHLSALGTLLTDSRQERVQNRLLAVAGETARLAGWLSYLVENRAVANAYYDRGLALARVSGDGLLVGRLLVAKSLLYSNLAEDVVGPTGTTGTVISMLQQAIDAAGPHAPARLSVWAHERLAVEHASGGDEQAAGRALERAHTLLDIAPSQAEGLPTDWDSVWLDAYGANVYRLLGRPGEAINLLQGALRDVNPEHWYDQSVYWCAVAVAYVSMAEVEGACEALSRSLSVAVEHRLPGRVRQVIAARPRLTRWEDSPPVKRLDQEIEAARW
jgi:tetratricopeptide (TPR) repeat protein